MIYMISLLNAILSLIELEEDEKNKHRLYNMADSITKVLDKTKSINFKH